MQTWWIRNASLFSRLRPWFRHPLSREILCTEENSSTLCHACLHLETMYKLPIPFAFMRTWRIRSLESLKVNELIHEALRDWVRDMQQPRSLAREWKWRWIKYFAHQRSILSGTVKRPKKSLLAFWWKRSRGRHVMQIKKHEILISIDDGGGEGGGKMSWKLCSSLTAPILKIYFIQVLLKAVFIQEALPFIHDWGFSMLLHAHPAMCARLHSVSVCNFLFLIFNSIFNILLCAIATFPHYVKRKSIKIIIKKRRASLKGLRLSHSNVICGKMKRLAEKEHKTS